MQITVYGAAGKVGRQVVAALVARDVTVVAFVHRHNPFIGQANISTVTGSVSDYAAVSQAAQGSQVIISTLGSWGTPTKNIVSTGTAAIIAAATQHAIKRVITVTGGNAFAPADAPTRLDRTVHALLRLVAPKILADGEAHLKLLADSQLDWTAVRAPVMLPWGPGNYRLSATLPSLVATIPRRAVVRAIIDQVDAQTAYRQAPVVRRG